MAQEEGRSVILGQAPRMALIYSLEGDRLAAVYRDVIARD